MDNMQKSAKEAILLGSILALGIQKINIISKGELEKVYENIDDSFKKIEIDIPMVELRFLTELPTEEAQSIVIKLKEQIIDALEQSCSSTIAGWFELSFNLSLLSTTPEMIPSLEDYLRSLAKKVGLAEVAFSEILTTFEQNKSDAVTKLYNSVT